MDQTVFRAHTDIYIYILFLCVSGNEIFKQPNTTMTTLTWLSNSDILKTYHKENRMMKLGEFILNIFGPLQEIGHSQGEGVKLYLEG